MMKASLIVPEPLVYGEDRERKVRTTGTLWLRERGLRGALTWLPRRKAIHIRLGLDGTREVMRSVPLRELCVVLGITAQDIREALSDEPGTAGQDKGRGRPKGSRKGIPNRH